VTTIESVVHNGLIPTLIAIPLGVAGFLLLRSKEDEVAIRPGATLELDGRESSSLG